MSKNDITGDNIQTKVASESYRNNFDAIFRKPKVVESKIKEDNYEQEKVSKPTVLGVRDSE